MPIKSQSAIFNACSHVSPCWVTRGSNPRSISFISILLDEWKVLGIFQVLRGISIQVAIIVIFWDSNRHPRQYIGLSEIVFTSATLKSSISEVIFMVVYRDSVSLSRESLLPTSPDENETTGRCCTGFWIDQLQKGLRDWGFAACELAKRNARNGIFSVKMGMALILVSLLIFMDESDYKDINTHSVWAILTVVVVFEFTIGMVFDLLNSYSD
jgi:hypothetical protein